MRSRVVLFCGGSGASELVRTYVAMDEVDLTVLVNCYDDGLSTGMLRSRIPGMLGPSDIRKNVRHSLRRDGGAFAGLDHVLGFRFRDDSEGKAILAHPLAVLEGAGVSVSLGRRSTTALKSAVDRFASYMHSRDGDITLRDVALGNVVFAGLYLEHQSFNAAVRSFVDFAGISTRVMNVTDGMDLKLVGLTDKGFVVPSEVGISRLESSEKLADIFLLKDYLTCEEARSVDEMDGRSKREYLTARTCIPCINQEALCAIADADVIVYWPGTQHSSLFPSYLTDGLAESVMGSKARRKVLVTNVDKDHDIVNESAYSLVDKFFRFMARGGAIECDTKQLVTDIVMTRPGANSNDSALPLGSPTQPYPGTAIHIDEWGDGRGKHAILRMLVWLS